jgi:hypothetical protein
MEPIDATIKKIKAMATVNRIAERVERDLGGEDSETGKKFHDSLDYILDKDEANRAVADMTDHKRLLDAYRDYIGDGYFEILARGQSDILELAREYNRTVARNYVNEIARSVYRSFKELAPDSDLKESEMIEFIEALWELT